MAALYPQAIIVTTSILPRLDCDNIRVKRMNEKVMLHISELDKRFEYFDYSDDFQKVVFPGPRKIPILEYFRDLEDDTVHLSDSGTQVQQDAFNKYLARLKGMIERNQVDTTVLMWQSEWDRFNFWNMKTPSIRPDKYLVSKRITNFTNKQHMEALEIERKQRIEQSYLVENRGMVGPLDRVEAERKPYLRHLGDE